MTARRSIVHVVKKLHFGGTETVILSLCKGLCEYSHRVLTLSSIRNDKVRAMKVSVDILGRPVPDQYRQYIKRSDADVFIYHWYPEPPTYFECLDLSAEIALRPWCTVIHNAEELIPPIPHSCAYVAVSDFIRNYHRHLRGEKIITIKNGVMCDHIVPKTGQMRDSPCLIKVCRAFPERFPEAFFRMLSTLLDLDWRLQLVVGAGPSLPDIYRWLDAYGLSGRTNIAVDVEDVGPFFQCADIYCDFNAPFCREAWGMAITEAQAYGVPVVGHARGAIGEQVVNGVTGYVCNNDTEFYTQLRRLITNASLCDRLGHAARMHATTSLNAADMVQAYRALISHLCVCTSHP